MKVVHLTSVHPQNDNRIFYKECVTLAQNGYDVFLVAAGGKNELKNGVKIISYPKSMTNRIKRIIKTSFFDMIKICNKIDGEVYHFHDPELIFVGLYLKLKGKKVIYDIHENNPASILSKPYIKSKFFKNILSKSFDLFEKIVIRFFDGVITARPDITQRFSHKNIITLRNFPILPDLTKIKDIDIKKTKPSIVYVGGISSIRGINQLIEAFYELNEYELWLLGPIKEKNLERKILDNCKNIRYFGTVEPFEIFSYIKKADVGIITFLPLPNHINTLATKPFEYMACGKPMIMSDFLYWKNFFKDSSLYVNPVDVNDIRKVIRYLLNDKKLMNKIGELNLELSKNEYNWKSESKKLLFLYKTLEDLKQ